MAQCRYIGGRWLNAVALAVWCAGCSTTVVLQPSDMPVTARAQFLSQGKRFYVDRVKPPPLDNKNIGVTRSLAGRFWSRIKSDDDLSAYAAEEIRRFLVRHKQSIVSSPELADCLIQCDIRKLTVTKKYDWIWDDEFTSSVELVVSFRDRVSGRVLRSQNVEQDVFMERDYDDNETVSDEQMLSRCLSSAFAQALEKLSVP
jgi:hypothetical protein